MNKWMSRGGTSDTTDLHHGGGGVWWTLPMWSSAATADLVGGESGIQRGQGNPAVPIDWIEREKCANAPFRNTPCING